MFCGGEPTVASLCFSICGCLGCLLKMSVLMSLLYSMRQQGKIVQVHWVESVRPVKSKAQQRIEGFVVDPTATAAELS